MSEQTKVETVGDVLGPRWPLVPVDVERRDTFREAWRIIKESGLLDARIIPGPVCQTCGGKGTLQVPRWSEAAEREFGPAKPCPACHGEPAPVSIVTEEAWEAFARAMVAAASGLDETDEEWDETMQGMWEEDYAHAVERFKKRAPAVAAALLGGRVGVAKEVGVLCSTPRTIVVVNSDPPPKWRAMYAQGGDRIAILKNGGRDE